MSSDYRLRVLRAEGLHLEKESNLYAKVRLGDVEKQTRAVLSVSSPTWNTSFHLPPADPSAMLEIKVKQESARIKNPCVGFARTSISDLLAKCAEGEASISLTPPGKSLAATTGRIVVCLEAVDSMTSAGVSLEEASEDIRRRKIMRSEQDLGVTQSITDRTAQLANREGLYQAVGELMSRLSIFKKAMATFSEIHPFLTIAWNLANVLYSAVEKVFKTDAKVINLVRNVSYAFAFVGDVQALSGKAATLQDAIVGLIKQTIECCFFVSRYVDRSFLGRMLDFSSSQKIDDFGQALASFKQQIESGVILHTAFVSMQVPREINELLLQQRLSPARYDAFDRPVCFPNTRSEIRGQIVEWVFSDTKQNVLWLHGVAGSGKSTISTTVAKHFRGMCRLGAFLFFQRGKSDPSSVIKTVAYKLALFNPSIGSSILSEVEIDKDIGSASYEDQFKKLLLQPLSSAANEVTGPVVVVLDALDECGTVESRRTLMDLLQNEFHKLPRHFRFLITSRREADIDRALSSQPERICVTKLDYTSAASQQDVLSYLRVEMHILVRAQVEIPDDWPWERNIAQLGRAAGGLFIWASTAIKMIRNSDDPFYHLDRLIADSKSVSGLGLDDLYATTLRNSGILWDSERSRERFRSVLALLLLSKAAMTIEMIDNILGFRPRESCTLILSRLQSLISFATKGPINLFHASFSDYLTSSEYSGEPWSIDTLDANRLILNRCFSVMEKLLHFNICDLETSFVRNEDVPGLKDRVKERIPPHLEYVCIHWAQHLRDVPSPSDVIGALMDFAHNRLLFWFEVLSLIGSFRQVACSALLESSEWTKGNDASFTKFLEDAAGLATIFTKPIVECTPHIYVTMIPLSKGESSMSAFYSERMTSLVQVQRRGLKRPLKYVRVLEGHGSHIRSVSISPDGRIIASGENGIVRIWDFHGGEELKVLEHEEAFTEVHFHPDGKHIVSASRNGAVSVWDIETGESIRRTLLGCAEDNSAFAVSPDGTRAASGRKNGAVVVWNVSDETELARFYEHTDLVCSVAFSCDGRFLASGCEDGTIGVWDVENKELAFRPFHDESADCFNFCFSPDGNHIMCFKLEDIWISTLAAERDSVEFVVVLDGNEYLYSAAWSPCGMRIVFGCSRGNVVVLDATDGEVVCSFKGHTDYVNSVCFSPDGRYVISGSMDKTVRIWDTTVENGNSEYQDDVDNIVISGDGSRVASASRHERSVVIWDADSGDVTSGPLRSYADHMAFSPDNSRLISSFIGTIRVWDVESGQLAFDFDVSVTSWISCITVSPDNAIFVSADDEGGIFVRDMATGKTIAGPIIRLSENSGDCLEFSPD